MATAVLVAHRAADGRWRAAPRAAGAAASAIAWIAAGIRRPDGLPGGPDRCSSATTCAVHPAGQRPTARSTSRCWPPTTPTCCSGCCSTARSLDKVARQGLTNYWLIGVRGLALYWYVVGAARGRGPVHRPLPVAVTAAPSTALVWFGVLGGAAGLGDPVRRRPVLHVRAVQRATGTLAAARPGLADRRCRSRESSSGWPPPPCRLRIYRRTIGIDDVAAERAPRATATRRRLGRVNFLATIGLLVNVAGAGDHDHDRDRRAAADAVPAVMSAPAPQHRLALAAWIARPVRRRRRRRGPAAERHRAPDHRAGRAQRRSWARSCTPATARAATASPGRGSASPRPGAGDILGQGPRCAASARWPPTSTCAPATCRWPAPTTSPTATASCSLTRRSAR